jgi:hypothetical protein
VNRRNLRLSVALPAALVAVLVAAACGSTTPTSDLTIPPTGGASATPASSSAIATEAGSSEPSAPTSASPQATQEATPEASTETSPGASGSGAGNSCAGSADNQSWYVTAANGLPFDVYCPVLPATWYVDTAGGGGSWRGGTDQWLQISYRGPGGAKLSLQEGAFCTGGLSLCSSHDSVIGSASFGGLSGSLDALGPTPADGYAIYIDPGTRKGYTITGTGLSPDAFKAIVAGVVKVPKS